MALEMTATRRRSGVVLTCQVPDTNVVVFGALTFHDGLVACTASRQMWDWIVIKEKCERNCWKILYQHLGNFLVYEEEKLSTFYEVVDSSKFRCEIQVRFGNKWAEGYIFERIIECFTKVLKHATFIVVLGLRLFQLAL